MPGEVGYESRETRKGDLEFSEHRAKVGSLVEGQAEGQLLCGVCLKGARRDVALQ